MLMHGYLSDECEGDSPFIGGGWLRTHDAGEIDEAGLLRVHGRIADAINTGGETVWPAEVEAALATHPRVADVAVAAEPDAEWGERVVAYVVPVRRAAPPTLLDLREHSSLTLARYKAPREVRIVDVIPRGALGKRRRDQSTE